MVSERSHQRRREPIVVRVVDYTWRIPAGPATGSATGW
jgi:hypothetical protein